MPGTVRDPIFLGGPPRSGTSLMRAIVGSHPDVAIFEWDLPLWTHFYDSFESKDLGRAEHREALLEAIFAHDKVSGCHVELDPDAVRRRLEPQQDVTCGSVFRAFLEEYANVVGRPRWGLKTPGNELYAEAIFAAEPGARFVHLLRDPRDVAVSFQGYDQGSWRYDPERHISSWRGSFERSEANAKRYAPAYLRVLYEDLVRDPEKTARGVCAVLGLDFRPSILEMSGHLGWDGSNSSFSDLGSRSKGISSQAIGRYRTRLKPYYRLLYEKRLAREMKACGYEPGEAGGLDRAAFYVEHGRRKVGREIGRAWRWVRRRLAKDAYREGVERSAG